MYMYVITTIIFPLISSICKCDSSFSSLCVILHQNANHHAGYYSHRCLAKLFQAANYVKSAFFVTEGKNKKRDN